MKRTVQQRENYNPEALRGRCIMYVHIKTGIAGIHVGIRWVNKRKMKRRIKNWNICWTQIADALIFLRCCRSHMLQLRHDFTAHPIMICSSLLLIKDPLTKFMPQRIYVNALNHVQTFMEHPMHGCINSNGSGSLAVCRHAKKVMQQKTRFSCLCCKHTTVDLAHLHGKDFKIIWNSLSIFSPTNDRLFVCEAEIASLASLAELEARESLKPRVMVEKSLRLNMLL